MANKLAFRIHCSSIPFLGPHMQYQAKPLNCLLRDRLLPLFCGLCELTLSDLENEYKYIEKKSSDKNKSGI